MSKNANICGLCTAYRTHWIQPQMKYLYYSWLLMQKWWKPQAVYNFPLIYLFMYFKIFLLKAHQKSVPKPWWYWETLKYTFPSCHTTFLLLYIIIINGNNNAQKNLHCISVANNLFCSLIFNWKMPKEQKVTIHIKPGKPNTNERV